MNRVEFIARKFSHFFSNIQKRFDFGRYCRYIKQEFS